MRILLVEPHAAMAETIRFMLTAEGFVVETVASGEDAIDFAKIYDFDLILTETSMAGVTGFDVIRVLRTARVKTPIMVLSGLCDVADRAKALNLGADDFLAKPFHNDELIARIKAVVRRAKGHAGSVILIKNLAINLDTQSVSVDGSPIYLTGKEFQLLEILALRVGKVVTREAILNHLYSGMNEPELKIIDVYMCKVRRKLAAVGADGSRLIQSIWGRGYIMHGDEPHEMAA